MLKPETTGIIIYVRRNSKTTDIEVRLEDGTIDHSMMMLNKYNPEIGMVVEFVEGFSVFAFPVGA